MTNPHDPYEVRARGRQRLSALTLGVAAASVVGVGAVVAYDAHLLAANSAPSAQSPSSDSSQSSDDSSSGQQLGTSNGPVATQQVPQATSGGS